MNPGDEMLPCPYCGNMPTMHESGAGLYQIVCEPCDIDLNLQGPNPLYLQRLWNEWAIETAEILKGLQSR